MSEEQIKPHEAGEKSHTKPNGAQRAHADDVLEALANEQVDAPPPRSSFGKAIRDVVILGALLAGGIYLYYNHITVKEKVGKLALQASDRMEKDDLKALKDAEKLYQEILALDKNNGYALSGLAETYYHESRHGLSTRQQAEEYLGRAQKENAETPERFATEAYLQISAGKVTEADQRLKQLIEGAYGHPKLAHAWGLVRLEQGNYNEANRFITQAIEADFNAVRFVLSLAEVAHRRGSERAALNTLSKIQGSALNPDHELALTWMAALRAKNYSDLAKVAKWIEAVQAKGDTIGPVAKAQLAWAEAELALAMGNAQGALDKIDTALAVKKDWPPFLDLKARAYLAQGKQAEGFAAYEAGIAATPPYMGLRWDYAKVLSDAKNDKALALIDELERAEGGSKGSEFEIFRGNHYLKQDKIEEAKASFTKAADLGDDPEILLGLAKIAFAEEKKKDNKADLEKVAEAFTTALEARTIFPELHEFMGEINLWNRQVEAANKSFQDAEEQYKKLKRSVPELVRFFDHVIRIYETAEDKNVKKDATEAVKEWKKRKTEYLASVLNQQ